MNKAIFVIFVAGILLLSLAAVGVNAENSKDSRLENNSISENDDSNDVEDLGNDSKDQTEIKNESEIKDESEDESEFENESEVKEGEIKFKEKIKVHVGDEEVESEFEFENQTEGNETKIKMKLSNGFKEIKVMPSTASARALEVLGAKCEERNCTIELKEVGIGNETRAAYEVKTQKEVKVLGLFKARMQVEAQIDAENGEVIKQKKAWWAFLASESDESAAPENVSENVSEAIGETVLEGTSGGNATA